MTVSALLVLTADGKIVAKDPAAVEAMGHPGTGAPGFWVPRMTFIELELCDQTMPLMRQQVRYLELQVTQLRLAATLSARTATIAQADRDRAWMQAERAMKALEECSRRPVGDSIWTRAGLMVAGGAAVGLGCWAGSR